ncbi:MAG: glutamate ABC transporter substrate-binding protein [Actinomyces sp.]|uniref:glutamate ABC transporter substrate-binding protein n=1 Tax=Actinomyces sp. TaxID=29317 RepID=UPI0026DBA102|nr:glutamate ABC transporter substrate-binding protein [Actinomyces sp.]MDO4243704.1 glutamate ABC transporter substrate-binding protein [Actinomyces sp.]
MATLSRRLLLTSSVSASVALALAACADTGADGQAVASASEGAGGFDTAVASGPVAADDVVAASTWATAIKNAGKLRTGGTKTSQVFSIEDPATGKLTGFDAGLAQALARYIIGGDDAASLLEVTQVSSDTRETFLTNGSVDAVIATYTITPERAQKITFAGPYYSSGQIVLVTSDNSEITGVESLDGKKAAVQSNSTSADALAEKTPGAQAVPFDTNSECVAALTAGQVDAYVVDQALALSEIAGNDSLKIVGDPFTDDPYGIGLPKDSDAQAFVNTFLETIESDGTWDAIWQATIGAILGGSAPEPPAIGSVPGSETA